MAFKGLDEILSRPYRLSRLNSSASSRASLSLIDNFRNLGVKWGFALCLMQLDCEHQVVEEWKSHEDLQKPMNKI